MADPTHDEEAERRRPGAPTGGAPALADDGDVAFGAMAGTAVLIALLVAVFLPQLGIIGGDTSGSPSEDKVVEVEADEPSEEEAAPETTTTAAAPVLEVDLPAAEAALAAAGIAGVDLALDGRTIIATGEIASEDLRQPTIDLLAAEPNVEGVTDELTIAPVDLTATVAASQAGITLTGEVPSEAVAADMVERAGSVYTADRVTDMLTVAEVDGEVDSFSIQYSGSVTDPVLGAQLEGLFDGVDGATVQSDLTVEASGGAELALNSLEPIQFASGSAEILPASATVLDEAAAVLNAEPDLAIEVGGHTDSRGDDASNQALSEARAQAVVAALQDRGVTNTLAPVGYGEQRLKENPDDTAEQQQANRRIEFRVL